MSDETTATDTAALRKLLADATTAGPWGVHELYTRDEHVVYGGENAYAVGTVWSYPDAELIAVMRNQLPALLSELATAREVARSNKAVTEGYAAELEKITAERDTARREAEQAQAELERVTGVAKALRITVAEMLSGKQHSPARTAMWRSTLKYATEALATPAAEPQADVQPCGCRTLTPQLHRPDCPDWERVGPLRDMKWVRRAAAPQVMASPDAAPARLIFRSASGRTEVSNAADGVRIHVLKGRDRLDSGDAQRLAEKLAAAAPQDDKPALCGAVNPHYPTVTCNSVAGHPNLTLAGEVFNHADTRRLAWWNDPEPLPVTAPDPADTEPVPDAERRTIFRDCPVCGGTVTGVGVDNDLDVTFLPCKHIERDKPRLCSDKAGFHDPHDWRDPDDLDVLIPCPGVREPEGRR